MVDTRSKEMREQPGHAWLAQLLRQARVRGFEMLDEGEHSDSALHRASRSLPLPSTRERRTTSLDTSVLVRTCAAGDLWSAPY